LPRNRFRGILSLSVKIDIAKLMSGAIFNLSNSSGSGLDRSESLFRAYRLGAKINALNPGVPKSDRLYMRMAIDYYARVLSASKKKKFIAAYSLGCPVEILYAMQIVPFQLEATGWLLTMLTGDAGQLLQASSEIGLATEICSVHRLLAGAFWRQMLPRPNAVIWTNIPCENSAKAGPLFASLNECAGFFLDHPYRDAPREEGYLVSELINLISFLEKESGHRLSFSRLTEAINQTKRQIELCQEISELRKKVPSPFPSFTFLRMFMTLLLLGGQTEGTEYLKTLRQELATKARQRKGKAASERFRLIDLNLPPLYFIGSLKTLFQEYGVVEVINPFFLDWRPLDLDASQPLQSLARKSLMNPLMGICDPLGRDTLKRLEQYVREYRIDGAINYAHIGCGSFGGASRLVREALKKAGVPTLDLSCDITDPTVAPPEEMREQIVRFVELLEDRG
jgi:benzoyl-CoA reductase/2-hydroxyglutaryl-CoA dehydratase subunit BcrC/BadD/HgdB